MYRFALILRVSEKHAYLVLILTKIAEKYFTSFRDGLAVVIVSCKQNSRARFPRIPPPPPSTQPPRVFAFFFQNTHTSSVSSRLSRRSTRNFLGIFSVAFYSTSYHRDFISVCNIIIQSKINKLSDKRPCVNDSGDIKYDI